VTKDIFIDSNNTIIFQSDFIDYVYAQLPEVLLRNNAELRRFAPLEVTLEEVFINVISKRYGNDFLYSDEMQYQQEIEQKGFLKRLTGRI